MGNPKTGGDDDVTAAGKYLLIAVPEFHDDPISGKPMTSYLRLGAASTTWEDDPGGDLAAVVADAGNLNNRLSPAGVEVDLTGESPRPVFLDDTRVRGTPPHNLGIGERQHISSVLHTRGGWRDHSDGNRISTTNGDKVEIIRGNYKLIVMGRQDDIAASTGVDMSGNHQLAFGYTPGGPVRVEWTNEYGGCWHLQNTTEGCVVSDNYAGDFYEFKWGDHHETTIGSEAPVASVTVDAMTVPRTNPHIIDKTWAVKMESYTGSAALRIPEIIEETWATSRTTVTDIVTITDTTTATAMSATTTSGTISETTTSGTITEMTTVGAATSLTMAGVIADLTLVGNHSELLIGTHFGAEIGGQIDIFLGGRIMIDISAALEIVIGPKKEINIPDEMETRLSNIEQSINDVKMAVNDTQIAATHAILGMCNLGA